MDMDDEIKSRRINSPIAPDAGDPMSMPSSPGDLPDAKQRKIEDEDMDSIMKGMNEIDRKIVVSFILGVDVTEVFSPERVAKVAQRIGLTAGSSFDLTNGWDFNIEEHRVEAWKRIKKECPYLLIGSPPCT